MDTLGSVGEAAVLRRIFPLLPSGRSTLVGPGDDAAVLSAPDGRYVVTTDTMVHGPDFRRAWSSGADLGWKAAATNLADVAAMGARATGLVVALAAPADTSLGWIEDFARGLHDALAQLAPQAGVVGGDLTVSPTLVVAITAFGDLEGRPPVLRSGARVGDVLAVSGELGLAGEGLRLLFELGVDDAGEPDAARATGVRADQARLVEAQLRPAPPIGDGVLAALAGATAMLDVSDGLAIDARRIADASGVAVDLSSEAVGSPMALTGGEDHALLAAFPPEVELPGGFREIGRVVDGAGLRVDGQRFDERGGWDPYADWDGGRG